MPWSETLDLERNKPRLVSQPGFALAVATWQNTGDTDIWVKAQVGETPPTSEAFMRGAFRYRIESGEENKALATLFLGVPGGNRLFAMTQRAQAQIAVQHA